MIVLDCRFLDKAKRAILAPDSVKEKPTEVNFNSFIDNNLDSIYDTNMSKFYVRSE